MMHMQIDLETLDTTPTAVVLSVGVALFNPYAPEGTPTGHYWVVDTADQLAQGRTTSQATLDWWQGQSPEARQVLTAPDRTPAREVMEGVALIVNSDEIEHVWANGPDFDCVILRSLFDTYGLEWPFWKNRCHRTMKQLRLPEGVVLPERAGTHHNALDDAIHQARVLTTITNALGLEF